MALIGIAAIPAARGAEPRGDVRRLEQERASLAERSRSVVLELYSLETDVRDAQAQLLSVRAQAAEVARRRAEISRRVDLARRTHRAAQRLLAGRLRALYEHGDVDPLAVVLGSESLDEAMTGLDGLHAVAEQDRQIVDDTDRASRALARSARALAARSAELRRLETAAAARAASLARARDARAAYLAQLAEERRLKGAQIAALERRAEAAHARSTTLRARAAPAPAPAPRAAAAAPAPEVAPEPDIAGGRRLTVSVSAYALAGRTATGVPVGWGVVAVDPSVIPLGTRMTIPGYGEGVAADTGGAVRGTNIDVWMPRESAARGWGRRTVTITLH